MTDSRLISKSRLEALSDGVYAVALTLLVLDLKLPPLAEHVSDAALNAALSDLLVKALMWMLSFWVGALFWLAQSRVLRQYAQLDQRAIAAELAQLALIALLPFSTALIAEHGNLVAASLLYAVNLALLALLSLLRVLRLQWRADLRSADFDPDDMRMQARRAQIAAASALAAVALAFVVPAWNMLAMFGLALGAATHRRTSRPA